MMQRAIPDRPQRPESANDPFGTAPPFSLEAEQALLGALLMRNEILDDVAELDASHFFDPLHQRIFEVIVAEIRAGRKAISATVAVQFASAEPISPTETAPAYVLRICREVPTLTGAKEYARAIINSATRRELVLIGEDLSLVARECAIDTEPSELIEEIEARLYSLAEARAKASPQVASFGEASTRAVANIKARSERGLSGIRTGLIDLDETLGGLNPSDLIILAGRPSMGKTALATNIAFNVAKSGTPVDFYSLEMMDEQLAARVLAAEAGVAADKMRKGKLPKDMLAALERASGALQSLPLTIDQTGGISIAQLVARARRQKRRRGTGLIVVDYLQLMQASRRRNNGNRVEDVAEITTGLKALAKELSVPVLALSQLSRNVEHRDNKRPQLSDLRESGSIEQDADVVMFVFREEYYVERDQPPETSQSEYADWQRKLRDVSGKAEVILGKHRHGPVGTVRLAFDAALTKFSNLALQAPAHGGRHE